MFSSARRRISRPRCGERRTVRELAFSMATVVRSSSSILQVTAMRFLFVIARRHEVPVFGLYGFDVPHLGCADGRNRQRHPAQHAHSLPCCERGRPVSVPVHDVFRWRSRVSFLWWLTGSLFSTSMIFQMALSPLETRSW